VNARRVLLSLVCGTAFTAITALAASVAYDASADVVSRLLYWPNSVLQLAVPCNNIGTPAQPMCEGTPLNYVAFLVSFPLAVLVYSSLCFWWLRSRTPQAPNKSLERTREG
jgi:hypothetical protein